jgi:uncharacterized OsmC-like protein
MTVRITSEYIGDLNVKNIHGPSGCEFITTAPADNGGTGVSFSPTDLIAVSLGSCMLTIMGLAAKREGFDLKGASVTVDKDMAVNPRRIEKLTVNFNLSSQYSEKERSLLEACARTCPVKQSLSTETLVNIIFNYSD